MKRDITKLKKGLQDEIMSHVQHGFCRTCGGSGLNPKALASRINGKNIVDCMDMTAADLLPFLMTIHDARGESLAKQIAEYLRRMIDVGIGYLSLSRKTETLSGGEAQRLKMVRNLGGYLNNITYIFDEPTAGLHPADAERIGKMLCNLRDKHNNVLVVEHSRQMLSLADHIIEMGPGAGSKGGSVVFEGSLDALKRGDTLTAKAIREKISINRHPLPWTEGFATALSYCYKGKNIEDVMKLTIGQAMDFFDSRKIRKLLKSLVDVSLDYLTLGQPTITLSGGEVQRVKLASELHKQGQVYVLDEPSTGLHAKDIEKLLALLRKLVQEGNTVIMVEHRLELISQADWIIDMGPEGGSGGGEVIFQGAPEKILNCASSRTGQFLSQLMSNNLCS